MFFNMPSNKQGVLQTYAPITIPNKDKDLEKYNAFENNLSKLGFKLQPEVESSLKGSRKIQTLLGYYVQEKGKASTDANSFFVDISNPPTGESFYRELLTAMDVPQSQIEEKLRDMMTRFTGASNFVNKEDNNKNTSVSDEKESGYLNK